MTKNSDDIPFDLKHFPHIIYGGSIVGLKKELQRRITFFLSEPAKRRHTPEDHIHIYINDVDIEQNSTVQVGFGPYKSEFVDEHNVFGKEFALKILINNNSHNLLRDTKITLIFEDVLSLEDKSGVRSENKRKESMKLPDRTMLLTLSVGEVIHPGEWILRFISVVVEEKKLPGLHPARIQIASPNALRQLSFVVNVAGPAVVVDNTKSQN